MFESENKPSLVAISKPWKEGNLLLVTTADNGFKVLASIFFFFVMDQVWGNALKKGIHVDNFTWSCPPVLTSWFLQGILRSSDRSVSGCAQGSSGCQFHSDQVRLSVCHETVLAVYDANKMECGEQILMPQEVVSSPISNTAYSCNSQLGLCYFY
ncbi:hypothetical protein V6N12_011459 [Hibiscus sabdariffa]|uniref:Uncharacterized protein n=1 Tax=Hibiscus sabdariffa TaxID=183260 RepID=A0ABR2BMX4_9ROSI